MAPIKPKSKLSISTLSSKPVGISKNSKSKSKSKIKSKIKSKSQSTTKPHEESATLPSKKKSLHLAQLEKEIPKLNTIIPAGVIKPKGKKKGGKVFVEDRETMMSILNMVNENKEGQIAGKLERSRQIEAVREARRQEQESRQRARDKKLSDAKAEIARRKRRKGKIDEIEVDVGMKKSPRLEARDQGDGKKKKKRVSFA